MKTLRDEWNKEGYTNLGLGRRACSFIDEYGDWRVVEGVLVADECEGPYRIRLRFSGGHGGFVEVGQCGDRVKLILPPEKKRDIERELSDLEAEAHRCRARAVRYERALREIVSAGSPFEAPGRDDACALAAERFAIAREALENE